MSQLKLRLCGGPESKRVYVAGHAQHIDSLFRNARYQVTFLKVREEFEDDCVQGHGAAGLRHHQGGQV